jgi:hypothetical protein
MKVAAQRLYIGASQKKNVVKDAAAQKMDRVRSQRNSAMKQIQMLGRTHRILRYAIAHLPVHPQYIDAGTLYAADMHSRSMKANYLKPPLSFNIYAKILTAAGVFCVQSGCSL